jgi:hypothetical protein
MTDTVPMHDPQPCCYAAATPTRAILDGAFPPIGWFARLVDKCRTLGVNMDEFNLAEANIIVHEMETHGYALEVVQKIMRLARVANTSQTRKEEDDPGPCIGCGIEPGSGIKRRRFGKDKIVLCTNCFTKSEWESVVLEDVQIAMGTDIKVMPFSELLVTPADKLPSANPILAKVICTKVHELTEGLTKKAVWLTDEQRTRYDSKAAELGLDKVDPSLNIAQTIEAIHRMIHHGDGIDTAIQHAREIGEMPQPH